jgi:hypothetical protein
MTKGGENYEKSAGMTKGRGNDIRIRWHMKNQQQKLKMKIA